MGRKGKGKKSASEKGKKKSGGLRHRARARAQIRRLRMKIRRWQRYIEEGKQPKLGKDHVCHEFKGATCHSRHHNWDVQGLEKQLALYERIAKQPAKC